MWFSWTRPRSLQAPSASASSEVLARAEAATDRPWVLFVGEDEGALEAAAAEWIAREGGLPAIGPPEEPPLPIAVHALPRPGLSGARVLSVPRIDRGFFDTLARGAFSATSPLYLIPRLAELAGEGEPLSLVATAIGDELEARAPEVLAQRGLASRFEIRRVAGGPSEPSAEPPPAAEIESLATVELALALGLHTREPEIRARAYAKALELDSECALAHLFHASSLLERDRPLLARSSLEEAVRLDPELPAAHYELGKIAIQTGDMDAALAAFERTTELLPSYPSAWGNLGAALGELQRLDEAAVALERATALEPRNHALRSNLGVTFRDQGRLDEAEEQFVRALALEPDFVFGHYNLASVLYLKGRYTEAIETFERARSMDRSRSPRQSLLLATARLASGDVEGARKDYQEVFARLDAPMRADMRTVAEWDLRQLAERVGVSPPLREAVALLRSLGQ